MKHKIGDTIMVKAKVEHIETYGSEITYFVSSDIFDGYGEIVERDEELHKLAKCLAKECKR